MTTLALKLVMHARENGYAVPACNIHNTETAQALLLAAERAESPVFLQVGRAVISHMGLLAAHEMTRRVAEESEAIHVIHLDNGTKEEVLEALTLGFRSVMYDGGHLPFEERIRETTWLTAIAHDFGALVEAELGRVHGAGVASERASHHAYVKQAERFAAETDVDVLGISAGAVHGVSTLNPDPLAIGLIEKIRSVVPVPLVLHEVSGVPDEELRAAIGAGVHKLDADNDLRREFRRGIEEAWGSGDRQLETAMTRGRELMVEATVQKMQVFGGSGRASEFLPLTTASARHW